MLEVHNNISQVKQEVKTVMVQEKVKRIQELYNLSEYSYIYSDGNSRGDYEMLKMANESHYKPFHLKL